MGRRVLTSSKVYDENLYAKLKSLRLGFVGLLSQNYARNQKCKINFFEGKIDSPKFNYDHIDFKKLQFLKDEYLIFKNEVLLDKAQNVIVKDLYIRKIDEFVSQIDFILMIAEAAHCDWNDEDSFVRAFNHFNTLFFGVPEEFIFRDVLQEIKDKLDKLKKDSYLKSVYIEEFVNKYLNFALPIQHSKRVNFANNKLDKNVKILKNAKEVKNYFEEMLKREDMSEIWSVEIDKTFKKKSVTIGQHSRRIIIPADSKFRTDNMYYSLSANSVQRIVAHEILTHVRRSYNGYNSGLRILELGLDNSHTAEEGVATFREQELFGENKYFSGGISYFAIGIAHGLDGGGCRSFCGVFNVLLDYYFIINSENLEKAKELAWNRTIRVFRGTSGTVPGLVLHKDLIYRAGNMKIHSFLNENPDKNFWLDVGRFDPTNKIHIDSLKNLEII